VSEKLERRKMSFVDWKNGLRKRKIGRERLKDETGH
jgi:hypothetical protein